MQDAQLPITPAQRDGWLRESDDSLLADCTVDTYRASGPGGQKRNKTSSAVRLRHYPSGLSVISEESRSQHENKHHALRRLRMAIAIQIRAAIDPDHALPADLQRYVLPDGRIRIGEKNDAYPRFVAFALDSLAANRGSTSKVAGVVCSTSSQLLRLLARNGAALAAVNGLRKEIGLHPLKPPPGK
jgi:hypothetical protein